MKQINTYILFGRISFLLGIVLTVLGCSKKLENDVSALQEQLQMLTTEIATIQDSNEELDGIVEELQSANTNFEALYSSDFIGCWYTLNSALQGAPTEIQIYPGGVGSLDFGGGTYQVFSWSEIDGVTTLHFGDILYCSCFGVDYNFIMDSAQILYGEMFDRDHTLVLGTTENQTDYFELTDWNDFTLTFDRCIVN